MNDNQKLIWIRTGTIIWAIIIAWLSTSGGVQLPPTWLDAIGPDKIGHLVVYAVLTYLLFHFQNGKVERRPYTTIFLILIASLYGILFEFIQYKYFPDRYFEVFDMCANILGAIIGWRLAVKKSLSPEKN